MASPSGLEGNCPCGVWKPYSVGVCLWLPNVKEMARTEYVLSTMLRTLYNFALACTRHDWACMREAFHTVLLEIEAGTLSWADVGPINLILKQAIIDIVARPAEEKDTKSRQTGKSEAAGSANGGNKREPRTCTKYQKGICSETHSHYIGRWMYHHSCSICLKQTSELVNHPANDCPRHTQTRNSPAPKNPQGATGGF